MENIQKTTSHTHNPWGYTDKNALTTDAAKPYINPSYTENRGNIGMEKKLIEPLPCNINDIIEGFDIELKHLNQSIYASLEAIMSLTGNSYIPAPEPKKDGGEKAGKLHLLRERISHLIELRKAAEWATDTLRNIV